MTIFRPIVLFAGVFLAQPIGHASPRDTSQQNAPADSSDGAALAVAVLVDVSRGSWPLRDLVDLKEALRRALAASLRDGDWVAVGTISEQIRISDSLTRMPADIPPLLREPFDVSWDARHGNTPIWDAVDRSVSLLARAPPGTRRVVLLHTSGRPAGNVLSLSEVVARARAAGVAVHVAVRPNSQSRLKQQGSTSVLWIRPEVLLRQLSTSTGGALVTTDVLSLTGLPDVFAQMVSSARDRVPASAASANK